jgi:hypothetical protein
VAADDENPEVLQLNSFPVDEKFAKQYSKIPLDTYSAEEHVVLLPRCCQTRVGSTDRGRVNDLVNDKKKWKGIE